MKKAMPLLAAAILLFTLSSSWASVTYSVYKSGRDEYTPGLRVFVGPDGTQFWGEISSKVLLQQFNSDSNRIVASRNRTTVTVFCNGSSRVLRRQTGPGVPDGDVIAQWIRIDNDSGINAMKLIFQGNSPEGWGVWVFADPDRDTRTVAAGSYTYYYNRAFRVVFQPVEAHPPYLNAVKTAQEYPVLLAKKTPAGDLFLVIRRPEKSTAELLTIKADGNSAVWRTVNGDSSQTYGKSVISDLSFPTPNVLYNPCDTWSSR
ncbi:MAG: hypothetical protein KGO96_01415 [Elusimicrobia bacterium]|nr:hypothetical protein [Elusimicrobiota bacterium]MDE2424554.1 hypothetical protein [Elusimicrobiota bacterium]